MAEPSIYKILKNSNYGLNIFSDKQVEELEKRVVWRDSKPYTTCLIRDREILLKPEEVVRQLYLTSLLNDYKYPKSRIRLEHPIHFGREVKAADIVVFDKDRPTVEYIIVEVKKPKEKDGKEQLRSYCNATGCPIGVWTNGGQISRYNRKDPNYFEEITDIPNSDESISTVLRERFTLLDLIIKDKIPNEGKSLKQIILGLEDEVLANAGVDVFEEVFKLIFTKLYDEHESKQDKDYLYRELKRTLGSHWYKKFEIVKEHLSTYDDDDFRILEFRNTGQSDSELKTKIQGLFDAAKRSWKGIFPDESRIELTPSHLAICVSSLQDVKLFNTNLQVIDEAFEYLVSKSAKGEKGQYFTPRHVIDMCVKMLNPKKGESMVDTAAGSCGFPVHTIFYIFNSLLYGLASEEKEDINKIFGIDFDEKVVRVARTLNLIAGDGNTNVMHLNTLDYERWNESSENTEWSSIYGDGFRRLDRLKRDDSSNKEFNFDIVMANPPFAGDIKEPRIIHKYELGYNDRGKPKSKVGRDILFIERNLDFLKPGGRLAIVLPQGRFNNTSDKSLRNYISDRARIIAVVGLHVNTFKPHTGTKTSILFLQKWNDDPSEGPLCPKANDYPIFLAVSEKPGKDSSGDYVYLRDELGKPKIDGNGHLITDNDLYNHALHDEHDTKELPDGIAEAFIKWAKDNKLSFWY